MATKPVTYFYSNGIPAVIGQIIDGKADGRWRGYYESGQPMWEADGGFFSEGGVFWRMKDQLEDYYADLAGDEEDDGGWMKPNYQRAHHYNPVTLVSFWNEEGEQLVTDGTGQLRHRTPRALSIDEEMKQLLEDIEPDVLSDDPIEPRLLAGNKSYQIDFADGIYHGCYREFVDGELTCEVFYNRGKRDGIERWWTERGQLISLEQWKDGEQIGMYFSWDFDGSWDTVHEIGEEEDKLIAAWDESGKLTLSNGHGYTFTDGELRIYFNGELVAWEEQWFNDEFSRRYWLNNIDIPYTAKTRG